MNAKLRRFVSLPNKTADFLLYSLWCIYMICDRNGKACHNCRKSGPLPVSLKRGEEREE